MDLMNETSNRSFGRTVVAALVFLVAAWLLLVAAVVAVIWALRVLL